MATLIPPVIHFFAGMGFRPAVQVMQRDQYGDKLVWIVGDDAALDGKVPAVLVAEDAPQGFGFVDLPVGTPAITAASLAKPVPGQTFTSIPPNVFTLFPPVVVCCDREPPGTVVVPPVEQPAQVPVEAGAGALLLAAICLLFARKVWAAMGTFGDWFTAERGTGPHQNGWL